MNIDASAGNFRAILQLHSMGNPELAAHLREFLSNVTSLKFKYSNESITLIGEELLSGISFKVKEAPCFVVIAGETTNK